MKLSKSSKYQCLYKKLEILLKARMDVADKLMFVSQLKLLESDFKNFYFSNKRYIKTNYFTDFRINQELSPRNLFDISGHLFRLNKENS